jgi:sulfhydrogenase subunit delta
MTEAVMAVGALGMGERALQRVYRTFNANAPAFREESERHGS